VNGSTFEDAWHLPKDWPGRLSAAAPFNPNWRHSQGRISFNPNEESGKVITVVPHTPPPGGPAGYGHVKPGDPDDRSIELPRYVNKTMDTAEKVKESVEHNKENMAKTRDMVLKPKPKSNTPNQTVAVPTSDLPGLLLQLQRELDLLTALKTQNALVPIQDLFLDLTKQSQSDLLAKLRDPDPWTRMLTAIVIGNKRLPVAKQLIPLLDDPVVEVREAAHQALVRLARGTDLGPTPVDSQAKIQQAVERWNAWLAGQEAFDPGFQQGLVAGARNPVDNDLMRLMVEKRK